MYSEGYKDTEKTQKCSDSVFERQKIPRKELFEPWAAFVLCPPSQFLVSSLLLFLPVKPWKHDKVTAPCLQVRITADLWSGITHMQHIRSEGDTGETFL